jgi:uroporphyrinogen-III synthase
MSGPPWAAPEVGQGRTLEGRVVLVTRPLEQAGHLSRKLEARGARPLLAPAIRLEPAPPEALDVAIAELAGGGFSWLVVTSPNGVDAVFDRMRSVGLAMGKAGIRVAAIGAATAAALARHGVQPDLVPAVYTTEELGRALPAGNGRVLLARADVAGGELEAAVAAKGWTPVRVDAYRTVFTARLPSQAARALLRSQVDAVTFTSASAVRGFLGMARSEWEGSRSLPKVVCIGPVTARAAEDAGMDVAGVAHPHTIEGLVGAVEAVLPPGRKGS